MIRKDNHEKMKKFDDSVTLHVSSRDVLWGLTSEKGYDSGNKKNRGHMYVGERQWPLPTVIVIKSERTGKYLQFEKKRTRAMNFINAWCYRAKDLATNQTYVLYLHEDH